MNARRRIWIGCLAGVALILAVVCAAQVIQNKAESSAQRYRKMLQSQELTQQMSQTQNTYQEKAQVQSSNRKMIQGANGGGNGRSGQQGPH